MPKTIPLKTAKAALAAMEMAADWIAIGEEGTNQKSWFTVNASFDRRRLALKKAIERAEGQ